MTQHHTNSVEGIVKEFEKFYPAHMDFMLRDGSLARPTKRSVDAMTDYLRTTLTHAIEGERERLIKLLPPENDKSHICRFNDGEQNCECWNECRTVLLQALTNQS